MLDFGKINEILDRIAVGELKEIAKGERHGSYERTWSITMRHDLFDLSHFLTVAITPVESPERPRIELWIGVDDGERFRRELVARFEGVDLTRSDLEPLKSELQTAVRQAEVYALRLPLNVPSRIDTRLKTPTASEPRLIDGLGQEPSS